MSVTTELKKIAGAKNVLEDEETVDKYAKDQSFAHPMRPKCVVYAQNGDTVQAVVRWANENRTPLVPISSGAPHFHGDTVPTVGGAVILDMSKMKKIIRVSYREQMALVEPGVTFAELTPALEKENLRPHLPLVPRSSKSVIGSYLEKEPILQPRHHWCPLDPLLTCQLILGSGELLQTGSSKGLWSLEEEWKQKKAQKWWASESYDIVKISQASQGTISVFAWAAIKCALLPKIHHIYLIPSNTLGPLIEFAYMMLRYRWGEELFILNSQTLACILAEKGEHVEELRSTFPPYVLVLGIAGFPEFFPEERVKTQEDDVRELAEKYGLVPKSAIPGCRGEDMEKALYTPAKGTYWKMKAKGAFDEILFVTTLDRAYEYVNEMVTQATNCGYPATDVGLYIQPIVQGTSCHCEFYLPYAPDNSLETQKVKTLVANGARALGDKNAYFYRPYGSWKEIAYRRISGAEFAALKKVKEIFDPGGILNPGKVCF